MRLKLDENLPQSAAPRLAALGFDVDTVLDENLGGRDDDTVWAAVKPNSAFWLPKTWTSRMLAASRPAHTRAC